MTKIRNYGHASTSSVNNSFLSEVRPRRTKSKGLELQKSKPGFTIAELVVVIALMAILIMFVFGVLISNNRFYSSQSGEIKSINSTREAGDKINEFARSANSFVVSHIYSSVTYTTGSALVVFQIPSIDSSGGIVASTYDYAIIGQDPNDSSRLLMVMDADAASDRKDRLVELSDKLSSISFIYDNIDLSLAKNIIYDITVTEDLGANPASEHVTSSATIRN